MLDKSQSALTRAIQRNLIAYMSLFEGLPNVITVDMPEVYWFVSHRAAPGNGILRASLTGDIDAKIERLFADIGQHVDSIGWFVFPHDTPSDLSMRLARRKMYPHSGGYWLWADLMPLGDAPALPDNFRVLRVTDDSMMAEWTRLTEAGFGGSFPHFYEAYARHGYGSDAFSLHYIGMVGDQPVTSCTLLDAGGTASVFDLSTPPDYRGRGYASALMHTMLREIRARGYTETSIWSSHMAQSMYRSVGFVDADFGIRQHDWLRRRR